MAPINVLIYNGPGVSPTSLSHMASSMKSLLLPHFAVQTVTASALATQSWSNSCALLIVPGGHDMPSYGTSLTAATHAIRAYVENGGAFLGICAGAYFASRRVQWGTGAELEVSGGRPLRFFDGVYKGPICPSLGIESENGAHTVAVADMDGVETMQYHNEGGEFVGVESSWAAEAFAKYVEGEREGKIAAVRCRVGKGVAILWGTHPEYPLTQEPLLSALKKREVPLSDEEMKTGEQRRRELLRKTGAALGLSLPSHDQESNKSAPSLLPQILTSSIPSLPTRVLALFVAQATSTEPQAFKDINDTFLLHPSPSATSFLRQARNRVADQASPKDILFYEDGELPPEELTPMFSMRQYYSHLTSIRASHNLPTYGSDKWGFGQLFLYGEVVTSTQSMLDRNPLFLTTIPAPLLSVATHQLSGRGRGSNIWVSPAGCLLFSLLVRPKLSTVPASRLVFVQYLFGLAVVEACRELMSASGECIRLKWPNDVYALVRVTGEDGRVRDEKTKIGGILVSTCPRSGEVDLIIGCGLNVFNAHPTTSLSQLTHETLTMEKTVATIMVIFEAMWEKFLENGGSFEPFMDLYLDRWLHSDQLVTLNSVSPPIPVRIVGITADHGLLRTVPERGGEAFIDLQPDGNSFDMMANLIRTKT